MLRRPGASLALYRMALVHDDDSHVYLDVE